MPTVAVSTYSFGPQAGAGQVLDFALRHGFRGLELGSWVHWPDVLADGEVRRLRTAASSGGLDLSIHFIHRGVAPASHDLHRRARHLAQLQETMELAYRLGARPVVVHPGPIEAQGLVDETARREALDHLADFLASALPKAEETGVVLCLENLRHGPDMVVQGYDELVSLVTRLDHPLLRITLDVGHAALSSGVEGAWQAFSSHLRHVHVHDVGPDGDHYEVGRGTVDFEALADRLAGFSHALVMEVRDEADPEGCVVRSGRRLRELLGAAAR